MYAYTKPQPAFYSEMPLSTRARARFFLLGLRERLARVLAPAAPTLMSVLPRQLLRQQWPLRLGLMAAAMAGAALFARAATEQPAPSQSSPVGALVAVLAMLLVVAGLGLLLRGLWSLARRCRAWCEETTALGAAIANGAAQPTPWPWQRRYTRL